MCGVTTRISAGDGQVSEARVGICEVGSVGVGVSARAESESGERERRARTRAESENGERERRRNPSIVEAIAR